MTASLKTVQRLLSLFKIKPILNKHFRLLSNLRSQPYSHTRWLCYLLAAQNTVMLRFCLHSKRLSTFSIDPPRTDLMKPFISSVSSKELGDTLSTDIKLRCYAKMTRILWQHSRGGPWSVSCHQRSTCCICPELCFIRFQQRVPLLQIASFKNNLMRLMIPNLYLSNIPCRWSYLLVFLKSSFKISNLLWQLLHNQPVAFKGTNIYALKGASL